MTEKKKSTILNVDDDDAQRYATSRILRKAGLKVMEAANGEEALRLAKEQPDLVVLDVNLPDMHGFEICRIIKSDPSTSLVPVLHVSATYTETESRVEGLELGADGYLTHPIEPPVLIATVTALLRLREAHRVIELKALQWQATFDSVMSGICLLDLKGKVSRCNRAFRDLMGRPYTEIIGRTLPELDQDIPHTIASYRSATDAGKDSGLEVIEFKRADRWFSASLDRIIDDEKGSTGSVMVMNDITDRKRAEEELQARNIELDVFAGSISHDLRGALALVHGFVLTAIAAKEAGREEVESGSLVDAVQAAQRMNTYIESLLAYARAGHPEGEITRVEPGEVLREVLLDMKDGVREKGIEIAIENGLPSVRVDAVKMQQVMYNLVSNAVKFLGDNPHPRIEIGADRKDEEIVIYIRDNGIGIPPRKQEAAFEPFKRFSSPAYSGLGIGLSLVKRAVEAWGGEVWVESNPGEGSTFFFTAPADEKVSAVIPEPRGEKKARDSENEDGEI